MKKKKHSIDILFMFILFAVFAVLSVLIIYIGSGVYYKISEDKEINEQSRTTLSYVVNKVRSVGNEDDVYVRENNGRDVLVIKGNSYGNDVETLIYEYDNNLMEMMVSEGDTFDLQFGDVLVKIDNVSFEIDKEKSLLTVLLTDNLGNNSEVSVYLKKMR